MLGAGCGGAVESRAGEVGAATAGRQPRATQVGASEVGVVQLRPPQVGVDPDALAGLHSVKNGIAGGDIVQGGALQPGAATVGRLQPSLVEAGIVQAGVGQASEAQIAAREVRLLQLRAPQVDAGKVEAGEVGALQLWGRGPGLGRRRLPAAAGAVAMPDQVMAQQQGVLADALAVGLRQQLAGRLQEAVIAGGGLVCAGRQVGEQQIAEHGDAFAVEAGGVEGRGELVAGVLAGVDLPQAAGNEEFEKALVRKAVVAVAAAYQESGGAQLQIDALVIQAGGEAWAVLAHQAGEVAVVQALVGARPERGGQRFEKQGDLARRELHFGQPQARVVEPLVGVDQVEGAGRRRPAAGLQGGQAVQDDVQQLRHARQIFEAVDALDVGPGLLAVDAAEALLQVFADLRFVEGQQVVESGLEAARRLAECGLRIDRVGHAEPGRARLAAVAEEVRARGDEYPVGLWRAAGLRGRGGQLAELFLDTLADGGDAHFVEAVEQQDDAPGGQQVQQDGGVDGELEFMPQVLLQQLLQRHRVGKVLQIDGDRYRRVGVAGAVVGQGVGEVRHEGGLAGAVVAEQQPQPAASTARPGTRVRQQIGHRAFCLVGEADLLLHVPAGQRSRLVDLPQASEVGSEIEQAPLELAVGEGDQVAVAFAEGRGGGAERLFRHQHSLGAAATRLIAVQPDGKLLGGFLGYGAGVGLALDQIGGDFTEVATFAGDEVDFVAVEQLFLLDAVAEQLQQIGDLFLEGLATLLRGAALTRAIDVGARGMAQRDFAAGQEIGPVVTFECLVDRQVVLDDSPLGLTGGDHQAIGEQNVLVEADGLQPLPGVEPKSLPPLLFGDFAAGEVGRDRRGDEQTFERRQIAADRHLPLGQRLQRLPDAGQPGQILRAVVADEDGDVRQQGGNQATEVGEAGACVEQHGLVTGVAEGVEGFGEKVVALVDVDVQEIVPVDALVQQRRIGVVAVRGENVQVLADPAGPDALEQGRVVGGALTGLLPGVDPLEETALDPALRPEVGDAMQAWRFDVEVPDQRLAAPRAQDAEVGRQQRAADATLVAVEGDGEGAHAGSALTGLGHQLPESFGGGAVKTQIAHAKTSDRCARPLCRKTLRENLLSALGQPPVLVLAALAMADQAVVLDLAEELRQARIAESLLLRGERCFHLPLREEFAVRRQRAQEFDDVRPVEQQLDFGCVGEAQRAGVEQLEVALPAVPVAVRQAARVGQAVARRPDRHGEIGGAFRVLVHARA